MKWLFSQSACEERNPSYKTDNPEYRKVIIDIDDGDVPGVGGHCWQCFKNVDNVDNVDNVLKMLTRLTMLTMLTMF